jgi:hypothetical protein
MSLSFFFFFFFFFFCVFFFLFAFLPFPFGDTSFILSLSFLFFQVHPKGRHTEKETTGPCLTLLLLLPPPKEIWRAVRTLHCTALHQVSAFFIAKSCASSL